MMLKTIDEETAEKLVHTASLVKPVYDAVYDISGDNNILDEIERLKELKVKGDYAVFSRDIYHEGGFHLSLGYHSGKSGNIESIKVYSGTDLVTNELFVGMDLECISTRGAIRERIRPVIQAFGFHISDLSAIEYESSAKSSDIYYRGNLMRWWQTKGEFAFSLARGNEIKSISLAEQFDYALELVHEATGAELEARFVEDNYPNWVKEFKYALKLEALQGSESADRCKRLVEFWDKLTDILRTYGI